MTFKSLMDDSKKFRVYWNSMGYVTHYFVDTLEEAKLVIDVLTVKEVDDENIVWNTQGLEVFNEDEEYWEEWYSEDGYDIHEYFEEMECEDVD